MCRKSLWRGWSLQGPRASSRSPITSSPETLNWCLSWARASENVHGFVHLLKLATQLPHPLYKELSSEYLLGLKPLGNHFLLPINLTKNSSKDYSKVNNMHSWKEERAWCGKTWASLPSWETFWHRVHTLCTLYALGLCFQTSPFPGGGILSPGEARG